MDNSSTCFFCTKRNLGFPSQITTAFLSPIGQNGTFPTTGYYTLQDLNGVIHNSILGLSICGRELPDIPIGSTTLSSSELIRLSEKAPRYRSQFVNSNCAFFLSGRGRKNTEQFVDFNGSSYMKGKRKERNLRIKC